MDRWDYSRPELASDWHCVIPVKPGNSGRNQRESMALHIGLHQEPMGFPREPMGFPEKPPVYRVCGHNSSHGIP